MAVNVDFVQLVSWTERRWYRPTTLLLLLGILIVALVALTGAQSTASWALIVGAATVLSITWYVTTRPPRTPKGYIGFAVAISSETDEHATRLRADFVGHLRRLFATHESTPPFRLLEFGPYHAERLQTEQDARRALLRSRANFLVYGQAKLRQIAGTEQHYLELVGMVRHAPLPSEARNWLRAQLRELFPGRVVIDRNNDVFAFQLTSQITEVVALYIAGVAAAISNALPYALTLLTALRTRLRTAPTVPAVSKIRQYLPERLLAVYSDLALAHVNEWRTSRDPTNLERAEADIDAALAVSSRAYSPNLMKAICCVVLRRDIEGAKRAIRRASKTHDGTWRYSDAFLKAYEGNVDGAIKVYRRAFRAHVDASVPHQSEEFIQEILDREPEKTDLHLCLALINFHAKGDYAAAREDLQRFLERNHPPFSGAVHGAVAEMQGVLRRQAAVGIDPRADAVR